MSRVYNIRSMAKGNEAMRGDASTAPDNPGYLRIEEERGPKAHALSYNTTTMQMLVFSSSHHSMELGQNQSGSASSEQPGSGCIMSNKPRMMQMTALSTFDNYGARNGPNTSSPLRSGPSNRERTDNQTKPSTGPIGPMVLVRPVLRLVRSSVLILLNTY